MSEKFVMSVTDRGKHGELLLEACSLLLLPEEVPEASSSESIQAYSFLRSFLAAHFEDRISGPLSFRRCVGWGVMERRTGEAVQEACVPPGRPTLDDLNAALRRGPICAISHSTVCVGA